MRAELEPLGIDVTVIEPGYFRTGFLNAGTQIKSEKRIKEYDETAVGQIRARLDKVDNNQPGDVVKGSEVIVDILTRSGAAEGKIFRFVWLWGQTVQPGFVRRLRRLSSCSMNGIRSRPRRITSNLRRP